MLVFLRRSSYGANLGTAAAIDALLGIDLIFAVTLADSFYRATCCTSATSDTIIRNLKCHSQHLHLF